MWLTSKLSALHSSLFNLLRLRYHIDRPYEQKSLTYAAYGFMLLVLAVLIPVNYALQGYETVTTYKQDPNTTSVHWYHTFAGKLKPGTQCDDHIFSLGDTFQTTIGTLSYTLQSIWYNSSDGINNWGGTTIPYKGLTTDFCDVMFLNLGFSPAFGSVSETATVQCIHKDFQVNVTTTIDYTQLMASPSSPLYYLDVTLNDLVKIIYGIPHLSVISALDGVIIGSTEFVSWFCPMFLIKNETNIDGGAVDLNTTLPNLCTPPQYDEPALSMASPRITASGNSSNMNISFGHAMMNYMEVFASVVRYNLGSRLPGNVLVDPSAVLSQNTFLPSMSTSGNLTMEIQDAIGKYLPLAQPFNASALNQPAPPTLSTTYECHLTAQKSTGSVVISVVVATLSIGGSIWALLMLAVASFAKGDKPGGAYRLNVPPRFSSELIYSTCLANHGQHYSLEEGLPKSLNTLEEGLELQERYDLRQNTSHDHLHSEA